MARKDLPSPNAPNFLARVREEVHALLGKLGSGSDRALTLRDAIESGVIVPGPGGSLIPGPGAGAAEEPDLTPPPQPGAFTATPGITFITISQAQPFYTQGHGHSRTVVYGAQWVSGPLPVFADAVELDRFAGMVRAVASNPATTWHLWIKWESNDGVLSATPAGGTNGLAVTTGQDVALLLDALAGQITSTELASSLSTPIGQIPSISGIASEALTKANSNLAAIGTIQTELATLSGTPDYDNAATYELDDIVKYSGGLYRALGTTTGNLPTNTTYWQKIGDYASLGDAVSAHAAQLSDHETRITDAEGDLTAEATARETLATQLRGSYAGTDIAMVSAGLIHSERQARTTADSTEVSARQALSAKLTGAADPAALTLGTLSSGLLYEERQARAFSDGAQVGRIETLETAVNNPTTGLAATASYVAAVDLDVGVLGGTVAAQGTAITSLQVRAGRVVNYLIRSAGSSSRGSDYPGVFSETGAALTAGVRSYVLVVFNGSTGAIESAVHYDVFGGGEVAEGRNAASMAAAMNALGPDKVVAVYTWDEPRGNRLTGGLPEAMYRCGASRSIFGAPDSVFRFRSAYILVGIPGIGEGAGIERYAGSVDDDPLAYCEYGLQLVNGRPVGLGGNPLHAAIMRAQAAQVDGDSALAQDIETLTVAVGNKASTSYVDSVEARVDTVEGTVSSQGTLISGLSSDLSDLTGVVGTKANASALTETNTNVSNLAGTVSAQAGQITTLQSQVIGGVNLAKNSDKAVGFPSLGPGITVTEVSGQVLPDGTTGTVVRLQNVSGVAVRVPNCIVGTGKYSFGFWHKLIAGSGSITIDVADVGAGSWSTSETWQKLVREDFNATTYSASVYHFMDINIPVGMTLDIYQFKVEQGSKLTGWSPSHKDFTAALQVEATTRATQTGELYAQYTVKTDVGGLVSGYGLASSANNAAPTSAFGVQAGQFFVAPPAVASATAPTVGLFKGYAWRDTVANVTKYWTGSAWSTSPQSLPFVVQAVPTTINGVAVPAGIYAADAFIQNGTITNLKVANGAIDDLNVASVSAGKLTAGSIAVGQHIQSTGYVAGSAGWRINGDGTAEFSQVVVRGTIFASQGAIGGWTIGSNYLQSTTYVLGTSGTRLNSDGTGQIGGLTVLADKVRNTAYSDFFEGFELGGNGVIRAYSNVGQNVLNTGATGTGFFIKAGNSFVLRANGDLSTTGRVQSTDGRTYFDPKASGSSPVFLVRDSAFSEKVRIEAEGRAVFNDVVLSRPNIVASGTWSRPGGMPQWDFQRIDGIWQQPQWGVFLQTGYTVLEDVLQQGGPSFVAKGLVTGTYMSPSQPSGVVVYSPYVDVDVAYQTDHYVSGSVGTPGGTIALRINFRLPDNIRSGISAIRFTSINWSLARLT